VDQSLFDVKFENKPDKEIIELMKNGIINEVLEEMNREKFKTIGWKDFIEFIDRAKNLN